MSDLRESLISMALTGETCGIPLIDNIVAELREAKRMVTDAERAELKLLKKQKQEAEMTVEQYMAKVDAELEECKQEVEGGKVLLFVRKTEVACKKAA